MADAMAPGVELLVGLMAAQFFVHAAGWAMAAGMQRQMMGAEGHFSVFWAAVATGLVAYLADAPGWHAAGDLLMLGAGLVMHRGILRFHRRDLPDRGYAIVLLAALAVLALSLLVPEGTRVRVVGLSLLIGAAAAATAHAFWVNGRDGTRWLAAAAAVALGATAIALAGRALLALVQARPQPLPASAGLALNVATTIGLFFLAGLFNLAQLRLSLGRVVEKLLAQSQRDALTGVANRRGFMQALDAAHRNAARTEAGYGLLMVDIDHFKRINDLQGHAAGDQALKRVAQQLAHAVRAGDVVGRWGGEEFCLLLPACDQAGAEGLAERVRAAVAEGSALTVSVGVAMVDAQAETPDAALARADAALYRAKNSGRNRVVLAEAA